MASENPHGVRTYVANSDLSTKKNFFVKFVGDRLVDLCSANTDKPVGVLLDNPKAGQEATVAVQGLTKVQAGGALSAGAAVGTTSTGQAAALVAGTDTTKYVAGTVVQGVAAQNSLVTVDLDTIAPHRAA